MVTPDRKALSAKFIKAFPIIRADFPNNNKTAIAKKMGTQLNVLNDVLKGKREITIEQLGELIKAYRLNKGYFYGDDPELYTKKPVLNPPEESGAVIEDAGERYMMIREALNMNQEEMATAVGMSQAGWSLVESGKNNPTDIVKRKLHNDFGINYEFMLNGVAPMQKTSHENQNMDSVTQEINNTILMVRREIMKFTQNTDNSKMKKNNQHKLYVISASHDMNFN